MHALGLLFHYHLDLKTRNSALSVVATHLKRVIQPIKKCLVIACFVRPGELELLVQSYAW